MIRLAGILRGQTFSPAQHANNDRLILERTSAVLARKGCQVELYSEEEVGTRAIDAPVIFSMCQGPRANAELVKLERQGHLIINSPRAVQNCYRVNLARFVGEHPVLAPMTVIPTRAPRAFRLQPGASYWVKRGDVHATEAGDVARVDSELDYRRVLGRLAHRGVDEAVVQPHLEGTVVKFYGVVGTRFFRYYAERDHKVAPVAFRAVRGAIDVLVRQMGLMVYGGDAVLTDDGRAHVIDVNDWPSFAYFRDAAAAVIGKRIFREGLAAVAAGPAVVAAGHAPLGLGSLTLHTKS